jgi:hypothetical protein
MKELWYVITVLLMLGVLAGFSSLTTPTSAFVANLPPQWDFPTTEFPTGGSQVNVDLKTAFFDPDGDPLSFSVSPGAGVTAGVYDDVLVASVEERGEIIVTASDGKNMVSQRITVYRR